ncbi:hypothetical protein Tco_0345755 [Tanacetum coccineum]
MVALLEKIDGSEGFHQIVYFLYASHIRFALSKNPTIYDSHIKQFWHTAIVNTLDNGEQEITATIDGHVKTVTIASVRKYLKLADAGGLSSLPNTKIFDQLSLMEKTIRQEVKIPQSNFPTQTPVADEAAFTCVNVVHGGAVTTVSSIDARQGSGNIPKSPIVPHDSLLPRGHTPGSDEGSLPLHELTVLCTKLSNKVESLETKLKQTKQIYGDAFTKLIKKVKKLEETVMTSKTRRIAKIVVSDDEEDEEDPSKQGRSLIEEMDLDAGISLVPPKVSTVVQKLLLHTDTTADDLTLAETLMEIRKSAAKTKELAQKLHKEEQARFNAELEEKFDAEVAQKLQEDLDATERQRMAQVHQAAQGFTYAEWDNVLARIAADEYFVQQLQAGKKCNEEDLPMKLVKEIFENTMSRVQSFVPMGSELEIQKLKRASQEVLEEPAKRQKIREASGSGEEQSARKGKRITRRRTTKIEVYTKESRKYWKIIRVGNYTEAYQDFADMLKKFDRDDLDDGDTLWKLQRAAGVKIPEKNLDNLQSVREEDGSSKTMDPYDLLGCDLLALVDVFTPVEDNAVLLETRFEEESVFVFVVPTDVTSSVNLTLLSLFLGVTATNLSLGLLMIGHVCLIIISNS